MSARKDQKPVPLFSLRQAAERGVDAVYSPVWANKMDHITIHINKDGTLGPWAHMHSPMNEAINGRDPVSLLTLPINGGLDSTAESFYAYTGPRADSAEYKAAESDFIAAFSQRDVPSATSRHSVMEPDDSPQAPLE